MELRYKQILEYMESTLGVLSRQVGLPGREPMGDWFVFRYKEKSIHQAIVQKLARIVSGLHAAQLLMESGFIQEQGALQRMLDEFTEDVTFLCNGIILDEITPLHRDYLNAFYMEEFNDPSDPIGSRQKRPMVSREKIHSYISRIEGASDDPQNAKAASVTISKTYSGYLHGASPHIMEMFGGHPPKFHVAGMRNTPLYQGHVDDLFNYFYRGILAFSISAKAFGNDELCVKILNYGNEFATQVGREADVRP